MKRSLINLNLTLTTACAGLSALFILAKTPTLAKAEPATPSGETSPGSTSAAVTGTTFSASSPTPPVTTNNFAQGILFPYSILDKALIGNVDKSGNVDYVALKGNKNLELFLQAVATADLSHFPTFEVQPDPKDKDGKVTINRNAELYSLREMREKIIEFDSRALFALTEGTRGGPMLAMQAYRFYGLNDFLNAAVNTFINDPRNVEVIRIQNKVTLNDFLKQANDLFANRANSGNRKLAGLRFLLSAYTDRRGERSYFTTNDYQIIFKPRDRNLNQKESSSVVSGS
jgi:hypothetical protein